MSPAALWHRLPSLKYLMVGAFCALLNLLMQYTGALLFGAHYALTTLVAFLILVPLSFFIHKKVTFRSEGKLSWRRFALYTIQWTVLLGANIVLLALLIDLLHVPVVVAIALATLLTHVVSYLYSRSYVFQQEGAAQ